MKRVSAWMSGARPIMRMRTSSRGTSVSTFFAFFLAPSADGASGFAPAPTFTEPSGVPQRRVAKLVVDAGDQRAEIDLPRRAATTAAARLLLARSGEEIDFDHERRWLGGTAGIR